jgi:hypothetical protein
MSDFLNRIEVQRRVIKLVNNSKLTCHLTGLSLSSIKKWAYDNSIEEDTDIYNHLLLISSKLFFLSNKSQEQISEDYKMASIDVNECVNKLETIHKNWL